MDFPDSDITSSESEFSNTSDSDSEYFVQKKKYKSSIHHGLNRSRIRYHKKRTSGLISTSTSVESNVESNVSQFSKTANEIKLIGSMDNQDCTSSSSSESLSSTSDNEYFFSCSSSTSESESESDQPNSGVDADSSDTLHDHAKHSVTSLYTAIMLFVIKHSLSCDAFSDLLHLISSILSDDTNFTTSVYKLKESLKSSVGFLEPSIKKFCEQCQSLLPDEETQCSNTPCRNRNCNILQFYDLRLEEQLKCLFQDDFFHKAVTTPVSAESVCDITSGMLYKSTSKPADADIFLTLTMNTDDVALFSSSKKGNLWPVYIAVNELPVTMRFSRKYLIPCYIFCQVEKPNMLTYLEPLTKALTHLFEKGIEVLNSYGRFLVKARLLAVSLDLPARALVANMKQFNGKFACCVCDDEGSTVPGAPLHRYFPYKERSVLRTHHTILRDAQKSIMEGKAVNGIKGPSVLFGLKNIDMSKIFAIDWMHSVLLGVTKSLMGFWFSSVNRSKDYFIGNKIDLLNRRLLGIKVPDFVSRRPRSLQDYSHWKATEFREWLLHFSVPVLHGILDADAYVHFLVLVTAVAVLNSDRLTEDNISYAEQMLDDFCFIFPKIYGDSAQTMNVHLLRHLGRNCRLFGALYTHSCFGFESMNSYLKSMVHGTRHVNSQVSFAVAMTKGLNKNIKQFSSDSMPEHIRSLILKLGSKFIKMAETADLTEEGTKTLGKGKLLQNGEELSTVIRNEMTTDQVQVFSRLKKSNVIYHSKKHQTAKKGNSYTVGNKVGNTYSFGQIISFFEKDGFHAVIKKFDTSKFTVPQSQTNVQNEKLQALVRNNLCMHILEAAESQTYEIVPASQLDRKCVFMDIGKCFISCPPNLLEHG